MKRELKEVEPASGYQFKNITSINEKRIESNY